MTIPKLDPNENNYLKFRSWMTQIAHEKAKLEKKINDRTQKIREAQEIRAQLSLVQKDINNLSTDIEALRETLIAVLPNKF